MQQVSHVRAHPDPQNMQKLFVERNNEEKYRPLQLVSRSDGDSVQVCVPATITIKLELFLGAKSRNQLSSQTILKMNTVELYR